MQLKITHDISSEMIIDIIIYLLYNRDYSFTINKISILEMLKNILNLRGINYKKEILNYSLRDDFNKTKDLAEEIARKNFPKLFSESESQTITYLKSL